MADDHSLFLARSKAELELKTASQSRLWNIQDAAWSVDQDDGRIIFTSPGGITAIAPVQILGTFNTLDKTWMWGWNHPSIVPALTTNAQALKAYGTKNKLPRLTTQKLVSTESECWEFAAMACKLCDAQGAYRGPSGTTMIFMTFGGVTLSKTVGNNKR